MALHCWECKEIDLKNDHQYWCDQLALRRLYWIMDQCCVVCLLYCSHLVPALEHDVVQSWGTALGLLHPEPVLHLVQNLDNGGQSVVTRSTMAT